MSYTLEPQADGNNLVLNLLHIFNVYTLYINLNKQTSSDDRNCKFICLLKNKNVHLITLNIFKSLNYRYD